jgi:hypothetical protein
MWDNLIAKWSRARCQAAWLIALSMLVSSATAHPGSGIVVDPQGNVFFQDSAARTIWKVDPKATCPRITTRWVVTGWPWTKKASLLALN